MRVTRITFRFAENHLTMTKKKKTAPKDPTRKSINLGVNRSGLIDTAIKHTTQTYHGYMHSAIDEKLKRDKIK